VLGLVHDGEVKWDDERGTSFRLGKEIRKSSLLRKTPKGGSFYRRKSLILKKAIKLKGVPRRQICEKKKSYNSQDSHQRETSIHPQTGEYR